MNEFQPLSSPARPATSNGPATARQRSLLRQLEELFLAEGFVGFTLDELVRRMGCSKSTLYALANSKEQLAARVVANFFAGATERIEARIAATTDARELLADYLAGVSEQLNRASTKFMRDIAAFPPARTEYEKNSQAAAERIRGFITTGVADGVFREVHATLIAEMTGLLIEGIQTGVLGHRAGTSDAEAFRTLSDLLLGGVAARSGE